MEHPRDFSRRTRGSKTAYDRTRSPLGPWRPAPTPENKNQGEKGPRTYPYGHPEEKYICEAEINERQALAKAAIVRNGKKNKATNKE